MEGPTAGIKFGSDVAIGDGVAVVGAMSDTEGTHNLCGAAYVYRYTGGTWTSEQKLTPMMDAADVNAGHDFASDAFGVSVAVNEDADTIVVGAKDYDLPILPGTSSAYVRYEIGAAYVFKLSQSAMPEQFT